MKKDNVILFPTPERIDHEKKISIAQSFSSAAMVEAVLALKREGYIVDEEFQDDITTVYNFLYAAILKSQGYPHYLTDHLDSAKKEMNELMETLKSIEEDDGPIE